MAEIFDFQKALVKKQENKKKLSEALSDEHKENLDNIANNSSLDWSELKDSVKKILLLSEEGLADKIKEISNATRQCSPSSLIQARKQIEGYSNEDLANWIKNSTQKDWLTKPAFFRAIVTKITDVDRKLFEK